MADESIDSTVDQINITVEAQTLPHPQSPINTDADRRALFKVGLLMILIAIGGILNPPIATTTTTTTTITNKAHIFLSITYNIAIFFTLAFGFTQTLLSLLLHRIPELVSVATKMTETGLALMKVTLGFGTSLVLMGASSSWLALYVVFISIQFI